MGFEGSCENLSKIHHSRSNYFNQICNQYFSLFILPVFLNDLEIHLLTTNKTRNTSHTWWKLANDYL